MSEIVAGVIPLLGNKKLGLPYPDELYAVEPGMLLIDYALSQMAVAGLTYCYLPVHERDKGFMAGALGYERQGIQLHYIDVEARRAGNLLHHIHRGCFRAEFQGGFSKFVVLPGTLRIADGRWLRDTLVKISAPFQCDIPGVFLLDSDSDLTIKIGLRREYSEADILHNLFGGAVLQTDTYYSLLDNWESMGWEP